MLRPLCLLFCLFYSVVLLAQPSLYELQKADAYLLGEIKAIKGKIVKVEIQEIVKGEALLLPKKVGKNIKLRYKWSGQPSEHLDVGKVIAVTLKKEKSWIIEHYTEQDYNNYGQFVLHSKFKRIQLSTADFAEGVRQSMTYFNLQPDGTVEYNQPISQIKIALDTSPYLQLIFNDWDLYHRVRPFPDFGLWADYRKDYEAWIEVECQNENAHYVPGSFPHDKRPDIALDYFHFVKRDESGFIYEEYVKHYPLRASIFKDTRLPIPKTGTTIAHFTPKTFQKTPTSWADPVNKALLARAFRHFTHPTDSLATGLLSMKQITPSSNYEKDTLQAGLLQGQLHGPLTIRSGNWAIDGQYVNGKKDGQWQERWGKIHLKIWHFEQDLRAGPYLEYDYHYEHDQPTPYLAVSGQFDRDAPVGEWVHYDYNYYHHRFPSDSRPIRPGHSEVIIGSPRDSIYVVSRQQYRFQSSSPKNQFQPQSIPPYRPLSTYANSRTWEDTPLDTMRYYFPNGAPKSVQYWDSLTLKAREDWFQIDSVIHHTYGTLQNNQPFEGTFLVGANDVVRPSPAGGWRYSPEVKVSIETYTHGELTNSEVLFYRPASDSSSHYYIDGKKVKRPKKKKRKRKKK